jgi:hypothetical protein
MYPDPPKPKLSKWWALPIRIHNNSLSTDSDKFTWKLECKFVKDVLYISVKFYSGSEITWKVCFGSVTFWYASGSRICGSVPYHKNKNLFKSFVAYYVLTVGTFTSVLKDNKISHKTVKIEGFLDFLHVDGRIRIRKDQNLPTLPTFNAAVLRFHTLFGMTITVQIQAQTHRRMCRSPSSPSSWAQPSSSSTATHEDTKRYQPRKHHNRNLGQHSFAHTLMYKTRRVVRNTLQIKNKHIDRTYPTGG